MVFKNRLCLCALDKSIFSIRRVKAIYRGLASLLISVTNVAETYEKKSWEFPSNSLVIQASFGLTNAKMIDWKLDNLLDFLLSMSAPLPLLFGEYHEKITICTYLHSHMVI